VSESRVAFEIRAINDRPFLEDLLRLRWSGGSILLRGKLIAPADVDGLAASPPGGSKDR
jgi:hypothetical protein